MGDEATGDDMVLRRAPSSLKRGELKYAKGTLLLYPNRISYVTARNFAPPGVGGLLGGVVGQEVAGRRAEKQGPGRDSSVIDIPFQEVTRISRAKKGLNGNLLEVVTSDGQRYLFNFRYTTWGPLLGARCQARGRDVSEDPGGFTVR